VEIKIGVRHAARELVFESSQTPDEVRAAVAAALDGSSTLLSLVDDHGRQFLVPSEHVAYVEIGQAVERRVGFGAA
jgi:hypothetical protein